MPKAFTQKFLLISAAALVGFVVVAALGAWAFPRIAEVKLTPADFRDGKKDSLGRYHVPPYLLKWASRGVPLRVWQRGQPVAASSGLADLENAEPAYRIKEGSLVYFNPAMLASLGHGKGSTDTVLAADTRLAVGGVAPALLGVAALLGALGILAGFRDNIAPTTAAGASKMQHRRPALDSLRGLAAMGVVLTHSTVTFFPPHWFSFFYKDNQLQVGPPVVEWLKHSPLQAILCSRLMVTIFWVLSGVVLSLPILARSSYPLLAKAAAKRYFRLMPLAFVTTMASYLWIITNAYSRDAFNAATGFNVPFVAHVFAGQPGLGMALQDAFLLDNSFNLPLWTIRWELAGSLILFAVLALTLPLKWRRLPWLVGLITFVFLEQYAFVDFLLGLFLADYLVRRGPEAENMIKAPLAWMAVAGVVLFASSNPGWLTYWLPAYFHSVWDTMLLHASALAMVALAALSRPIIRVLSHGLLVWLGERSFALYAVHIPMIYLVGHGVAICLIKLGFSPVLSSTLALGIFIPLTLLVSDWLYKHVDQPSMALANAVGNKLVHLVTRRRQATLGERWLPGRIELSTAKE